VNSLTALPLWVLAIFVVIATFIAMAGPVIIRRCIELERLRTNNEVAGFTFAAIGVLYAVLLGFAVIVVWEEFNHAVTTVMEEAGTADAIYQLSQGIGGNGGVTLRGELSEYLRAVINEEWPAMEQGQSSPAVTRALDDMYATSLSFRPAEFHDAGILAATFRQLAVLTHERRTRLGIAEGTVPDAVWLVLFGGAALTVSFTFFFGSRSVFAQSLMTGMLAMLILSTLFVVVVIDYPFTGSVKVTPAPLQKVLVDLSKPAQ